VRLRAFLPAALIVCALAALPFCLHPVRVAHAAPAGAPAYAANGDLLPPNYREFIYLTTGIDMSYNPKATGGGESMFDNVFVNPEAYHSFVATGTWPDKTVLVLEGRVARTRGSINTRGHFQSEQLMGGFEVHVKDEARFPGKWAFFDFDKADKNGTLIPSGAPCYSCHAQHAAVDTTFVQFYPTLLPIARAKHTLSEEFAREDSAGGK